jgi:O-antigen ligase
LGSKKNVVNGLWALLLIVIFYGFLQVIGLDPLPWSNPSGAVQLTLGNPNFAGALLGMLMVLPFSKLFNEETPAKRVIWFGVLLFLIFLSLHTESLQTFFAAFFAIASYVILRVNSQDLPWKLVTKKFLTYLASSSIIFALLLFIPKIHFMSGVRDIFYFQGSVLQRLDYWRTGLQMFADHLWFGVGPDKFQSYAAVYRSNSQVLRDTNFFIPDRAHNVIIDQFANGGIFAGLLWSIFIIYVFVFIQRLNTSNLKPSDREKLSLFGAIWVGFVFQSIISPDQLLLSIVGVMAAGSIVAIAPEKNSLIYRGRIRFSPNIDPAYSRVLLISILVFSVFAWGKAIQSDVAFKRILTNNSFNQRILNNAIEIWPAPKPLEEIAIRYSQSEEVDWLYLDSLADKLLEIDSRSSQALFLKAICVNQQRDFMGALEYTKKALEIDPLNQVFLAARVKLAIAAGDKTLSKNYLDDFKSIFPTNTEIPLLEISINSI